MSIRTSSYQTTLEKSQSLENEAGAVKAKPSIGMRIYAYFKSAELLNGLNSPNTSAKDKGHNIRQLARFKDTLDYSRLNRDQVIDLRSKISTPEELVHFCMKYNPTQLRKVGIITEEECNTLKNLFDKTCEEMPNLEKKMEEAVKSEKNMQDVKVTELFDETVREHWHGPQTRKNMSPEGYNVLSRGIMYEIQRMDSKQPSSDFFKPDAPSIEDLATVSQNGKVKIVSTEKYNNIDINELPQNSRTFHDVVLSCMGDKNRKSTSLQNEMTEEKSKNSQRPATLDDWVNLYSQDLSSNSRLAQTVAENIKRFEQSRSHRGADLPETFVEEICQLDLKDPESIESFKTFCKLIGQPEPDLG